MLSLPRQLQPAIAGLVDLETTGLLGSWLALMGTRLCALDGPMGDDRGRVRRRVLLSQKWFVTQNPEELNDLKSAIHQCDTCLEGLDRGIARLAEDPSEWIAVGLFSYEQWVTRPTPD